ncbi:hypothetical protein [Lysobacter gummosus]|uniref:Uncharacterized protein n=1 Tax=Lysobacter gummosus TaxID=262324 RepID=A0ABY3XGG4_9GAMM|nr:hypothetical protein [Lysobacter gummosus]UNP30735.1 hypothetical protein MOV92_05615 [Lysobacter gummosus]
MAKNEKSSPRVARTASSVLRDSGASQTAKSLAGSALSQAKTSKETSGSVATKAAKALDDGRSSRTTKTLAGSVLTQKRK